MNLKNLAFVGGGAVLGLMVAGPIGAAAGALIGAWAKGKV